MLARLGEAARDSLRQKQKSWTNIVFLSLTPVIGVVGTAAYAIAFGIRWWEPALFVLLFGLVSFSVTAGYAVIEKTRFRILAAAQARRHNTKAEVRLTGQAPMMGAPAGEMHAAP